MSFSPGCPGNDQYDLLVPGDQFGSGKVGILEPLEINTVVDYFCLSLKPGKKTPLGCPAITDDTSAQPGKYKIKKRVSGSNTAVPYHGYSRDAPRQSAVEGGPGAVCIDQGRPLLFGEPKIALQAQDHSVQ